MTYVQNNQVKSTKLYDVRTITARQLLHFFKMIYGINKVINDLTTGT